MAKLPFLLFRSLRLSHNSTCLCIEKCVRQSDSLDLRKKVIDYVENGGSITKAAALFNIGRATIYRWLGREKLEATKVKHRQRKLDWKALSKDVQENPEARLRDRAEKFGVRPSAICYALKK